MGTRKGSKRGLFGPFWGLLGVPRGGALFGGFQESMLRRIFELPLEGCMRDTPNG